MADEIPGAREQLARDGAWLRAQIRELAAEITPEQVPDLPERDPVVADWQEQLQYKDKVTVTVDRSAELNTPELIDRAAAWLTAAGWTVERGTIERKGRTPLLHATGIRDGFEISVRIQQGFGGVLYTGDTATRPLYELEEFVPPVPVKIAETVSDGHLLCYECVGLGWCPLCRSRGWILGASGSREQCRECHGARVCPVCDGRGELAVSALAGWERDQYPELRNQSSR
ncbi:hypothetical protein [Nocardia sp. NPDC052566]|uniref:hypothetical protein n=1 Tax=Nocardia sp. NPDC052566 TaxID=3364330 RepID=UPI0037C85E0A